MYDETANLDGSIELNVSFVAEDEATGLIPIQDGIRNPFGSVHAGARGRRGGSGGASR